MDVKHILNFESTCGGIFQSKYQSCKKYSPGCVVWWMDGWVRVKAVLRIAYSNQK